MVAGRAGLGVTSTGRPEGSVVVVAPAVPVVEVPGAGLVVAGPADVVVAVPAGAVLGLLSSMFGIGGGVVMIPVFLIAARMPPHVVAATTSVIVALTAPVGVVAHAFAGDIDWTTAVPLVVGGLAGGAAAPIVAARVSSPRLITLLAYGLVAAAAGLALRHVT